MKMMMCAREYKQKIFANFMKRNKKIQLHSKSIKTNTPNCTVTQQQQQQHHQQVTCTLIKI